MQTSLSFRFISGPRTITISSRAGGGPGPVTCPAVKDEKPSHYDLKGVETHLWGVATVTQVGGKERLLGVGWWEEAGSSWRSWQGGRVVWKLEVMENMMMQLGLGTARMLAEQGCGQDRDPGGAGMLEKQG